MLCNFGLKLRFLFVTVLKCLQILLFQKYKKKCRKKTNFLLLLNVFVSIFALIGFYLSGVLIFSCSYLLSNRISVKMLITSQHTEFDLYFGLKSADAFDISPEVSVVTGLNLQDALSYNETPEDAYIFALTNAVNEQPFLFINLTRLRGEFLKNGMSGVINLLGHETVHLARIIFAKQELGSGFMQADEWPLIGEDVLESAFADKVGELQGILINYLISAL